jgi:hypothetical protein
MPDPFRLIPAEWILNDNIISFSGGFVTPVFKVEVE